MGGKSEAAVKCQSVFSSLGWLWKVMFIVTENACRERYEKSLSSPFFLPAIFSSCQGNQFQLTAEEGFKRCSSFKLCTSAIFIVIRNSSPSKHVIVKRFCQFAAWYMYCFLQMENIFHESMSVTRQFLNPSSLIQGERKFHFENIHERLYFGCMSGNYYKSLHSCSTITIF